MAWFFHIFFWITSFDTPNQATPRVFHAVSLSAHACHAACAMAFCASWASLIVATFSALNSLLNRWKKREICKHFKLGWLFWSSDFYISFHGNEKKKIPKTTSKQNKPSNSLRLPSFPHAFPSKSWTFSSFRSFVAFALSAVRLVMSFANEWWGFTLIYGTDSLWMSFFRASNSSPNSVMSTFNWLTLKPRKVFGWESMERGIERYTYK